MWTLKEDARSNLGLEELYHKEIEWKTEAETFHVALNELNFTCE